ncbi:prophage CP4-57 regulatory protein [Capybara microvirus Cap3_SP_468]|nr:prophage CP4-57 regulatory protein [Capybara microvirus Cap3_SP_468]
MTYMTKQQDHFIKYLKYSLVNVDSLENDDFIYRIDVVVRKTGISRRTIYRLCKEYDFPIYRGCFTVNLARFWHVFGTNKRSTKKINLFNTEYRIEEDKEEIYRIAHVNWIGVH